MYVSEWVYISLCCVCVSMCVNLYSLVWICFVYVFECVHSRLCKLREYMCVCVYVCALKYVCKSEVRFLFYRVFGKNYIFRNNFEKNCDLSIWAASKWLYRTLPANKSDCTYMTKTSFRCICNITFL